MNNLLNFYPFVVSQRELLGTALEEAVLAERIIGGFYAAMIDQKEITKLRQMKDSVVYQNHLVNNIASNPTKLFSLIDQGSITLTRKRTAWEIEYRYSVGHSLFIVFLLSVVIGILSMNLLLFQIVSPLLLVLAFVPTLTRQRNWFKATLRSSLKANQLTDV